MQPIVVIQLSGGYTLRVSRPNVMQEKLQPWINIESWTDRSRCHTAAQSSADIVIIDLQRIGAYCIGLT